MNFGYILTRFFIRQPRLRRFVTSILERNRELDVNIAGACLRINSRREHGYLRASRILRKNSTLRDELPVLMNLFSIVRDGDTFVDVGANVGLFTHSIARLVGVFPGFRIVSIEAHPDTYSRLSAKKVVGVDYLNLAISNKSGEMTFVDGAVSHVFTSIEKQTSYNIPGETITVTAQTLDDLAIASESIVLKIDVEGQELQVLQGAQRILANGTIRAVYIDGYEEASIDQLLRGHGFRLFEGRSLRPLGDSERTFSLLALRECRTKR